MKNKQPQYAHIENVVHKKKMLTMKIKWNMPKQEENGKEAATNEITDLLLYFNAITLFMKLIFFSFDTLLLDFSVSLSLSWIFFFFF